MKLMQRKVPTRWRALLEIRCECLQDTLAVSWVSCSFLLKSNASSTCRALDHSGFFSDGVGCTKKLTSIFYVCLTNDVMSCHPVRRLRRDYQNLSHRFISDSHVTSSLAFTLIRAHLSRGWTFRCIADGPSFRPLVVYSLMCLKTHDTASYNHMAKQKQETMSSRRSRLHKSWNRSSKSRLRFHGS